MRETVTSLQYMDKIDYLIKDGSFEKLVKDVYEGRINIRNMDVADINPDIDKYLVIQTIYNINLVKIFAVRDAYNDSGKKVGQNVIDLARYRLEHLTDSNYKLISYVDSVLAVFRMASNRNDAVMKRYKPDRAMNMVYSFSHKIYRQFPDAAYAMGLIADDHYCRIYPDAKNILFLYHLLEEDIRNEKQLSKVTENNSNPICNVMASEPGVEFSDDNADDDIKFTACIINLKKIAIAREALLQTKGNVNAKTIEIATNKILKIFEATDFDDDLIDNVVSYIDVRDSITGDDDASLSRLADLYDNNIDVAFAMGDVDIDTYRYAYKDADNVLHIIKEVNKTLAEIF